jgi:phage-related protein
MSSWTYGGIPLNLFGSVTDITGVSGFPQRRGDNITVPYRDGRIHTTKYFEQRTLSFGMAISGMDIVDFSRKMDTLKGLLALRTQQTLTNVLADGTTRTASAIVNKDLAVKQYSPTFAKIVIEFQMASPFFRGSTLYTSTTTIDASPKAATITNPGTAAESNPKFILTGPLQDTVITNSTTGFVLTYTGTIASPRVVTIQTAATGEYTCADDLANNLIGNLSHTPGVELMLFNPGANVLSIADDTATTGTVNITFYPPYL